MKRELAVKVFGCGYGLLFMLAAASCTPGDLPTALPVATESATHSANLLLSRGQMLRAIAARDRLVRHGLRPTETVLRRYDKYGDVVSEHVKRGAKWVARPSSISAAIAQRPLVTFIMAPGTASLHSMTTTLVASEVVDTVDEVPTTITDSAWNNGGTASALTTHDTDNPAVQGIAGEIYYDSVSHFGKVEYTTAGGFTTLSPDAVGDADYITAEASGTDWGDMVAEFVADTATAGSLRMGPTVRGGAVRRGVMAIPESTNTMLHFPDGGTLPFSSMMEPYNCAAQIRSMLASAVVYGLAGVAAGAAWASIPELAAIPFIGVGLAAAAKSVAMMLTGTMLACFVDFLRKFTEVLMCELGM